MHHNANLVVDVPTAQKGVRMPNFRVLFGCDSSSSGIDSLPGRNLEMEIVVSEELTAKSIPESKVLTVKESIEEDMEGEKRF